MNRICIAALMTVMICASGCGPSEQEDEVAKPEARMPTPGEAHEATVELLAAWAKIPILDPIGVPGGRTVDPRSKKDIKGLSGDYIRLLISKGADVNAVGNDGITPLLSAVVSKTPEIVTLLIEAGADVNGKGQKFHDGVTPVMEAVASMNLEMVTMLVEAGADVNAKNIDGLTPLLYAARFSTTPEMVSLLIGAGADVNAKFQGATPLYLARLRGDMPEIIKLLKAAGARE